MALPQLLVGSRPFRVLLVEDNHAEAELVFEMLSDSCPGAFDITHVPDMKRASAASDNAVFDCIVLDLQLPDTSGVETIRTMRERCPQAAIVAYSGLDDERSRLASLREGAQDFVSKNGSEAGSLDRSILFALERWRAATQHKQLQAVFAANPDAIVVCNRQGEVRFANPAAFSLLDLSNGRAPEVITSMMDQGRDIAEVEIGSASHTRWWEVRFAECWWDGEACGLASIRDVTETKALAERIRKLNKLELAGRLAGGLAHDFGNILACIDMIAEVAQKEAGAALDIGSHLVKIRASAESGRAIVRQLLSLERAQFSSPEAVALGAVLGEVEKLLREVLPEEIELSVAIAPDTPLILADRVHIEQVLLNLAFNARDALAGGGKLHIACRPLELEGAPVCINVSDTGCGIAPDDLDKVFDLFFTTKSAGRGSGLGLAMCQTMIEQAGGTIRVQSRLGEGTNFQIVLPRAPQLEALRPANAA